MISAGSVALGETQPPREIQLALETGPAADEAWIRFLSRYAPTLSQRPDMFGDLWNLAAPWLFPHDRRVRRDDAAERRRKWQFRAAYHRAGWTDRWMRDALEGRTPDGAPWR